MTRTVSCWIGISSRVASVSGQCSIARLFTTVSMTRSQCFDLESEMIVDRDRIADEMMYWETEGMKGDFWLLD